MSSSDWLRDPSRGVARTIREPQIRMTDLVEDILVNGGMAFIEAGTGTGKSFAYSIPSLLSGKRVIISTAKKTLQTQIFTKDLPFLTERIKPTRMAADGVTEQPVRFSLLKGKSNYVCKMRVEEFLEGGEHLGFSRSDIDAFLGWADTSTIGDFGLYDGEIPFEQFVRVSECVKKECPHVSDCGYQRNKVAAGNAQVLVVNHALLAYDLAMGSGKVLGPYDALIIDEAHQAPKYFREAFSFRAYSKMEATLARLIDGEMIVMPEGFKAAFNLIFEILPESGELAINDRLCKALENFLYLLQTLKTQFAKNNLLPKDAEGVASSSDEDGNNGPMDAATARRRSKYTIAATMVVRLIKMMKILLGVNTRTNEEGIEEPDPTEYLAYTQTNRQSAMTELIVTPLEVGPLVAPALLHINRCVMTSATLSTSGNFNFASREFGLHPKQIRLQEIMPSPFDYKRRSALYISQTCPDATGPKADFLMGAANEIHELLCASKGGAFILCASHEDMNGFYEFLNMKGMAPYRMMRQTTNVDHMLQWFKEDPTSVLLGAKTLWEGVDVSGLGLRLVIIPRIPFPNRADVVLSARKAQHAERLRRNGTSERNADMQSWSDFDLQEAILDLKQGAGRLMRDEEDRGIVACLDRRLAGTAKPYSGTMRNALPHPVTYDKKMAIDYLTALAKMAGATR